MLGKTKRLIQTRIFPYIKRDHYTLFQFGLSAFTLTPFKSLNSNARLVIENLNTAASKAYRICNPRLIYDFHQLLLVNKLVTRKSLVNVDFSIFCGFETLVFALQTNLGRAIPVWLNCIKYPIVKAGSQNLFILKQLGLFGQILGFYPRFVFDRGFAIPVLIEFMIQNKIRFYVRVKAGQNFGWKKGRQPACRIGEYMKDVHVIAYGVMLRLLTSPPPSGRKASERWYIITNDFQTKRKQVLHIYRCRFEIEETFKDLKHIVDLKKFQIKQKQSFRILLWFCSLAVWLAWWSWEEIKVNPHKTRSYFRTWWESFQREVRQLAMVVVPDG